MTALNPAAFRQMYESRSDEARRLRERVSEMNAQNLRFAMWRVRPGVRTALEIGCFSGGTTLSLLRAGFGVEVVDPFTGSSEHTPSEVEDLEQRFYRNAMGWEMTLRVHKGKSREILPKLAADGATFDLIYVDGSHDSRDVLLDAVLGWQLLRAGGVMIFDDYLWTYYDDPQRNPGPAIDSFLQCFAPEMEVLRKNYQVLVEKRS